MIVHHSLWPVLVPLAFNLYIMIRIVTDAQAEIRRIFIVPEEVFCFG